MIAPIGLGWRGVHHNLHPDLWCTKGGVLPQGKIVTNSSDSLAGLIITCLFLTPKTIAHPMFGTPFQHVNDGTRNQGDRCLASLDSVKTSMQVVRIGFQIFGVPISVLRAFPVVTLT